MRRFNWLRGEIARWLRLDLRKWIDWLFSILQLNCVKLSFCYDALKDDYGGERTPLVPESVDVDDVGDADGLPLGSRDAGTFAHSEVRCWDGPRHRHLHLRRRMQPVGHWLWQIFHRKASVKIDIIWKRTICFLLYSRASFQFVIEFHLILISLQFFKIKLNFIWL